MPVYKRNTAAPERFFGGNVGRVLEPGDLIEADENPDWQYFDEEPDGTVIPETPVEPPAVPEEPAS
jgi:hypothetical protein